MEGTENMKMFKMVDNIVTLLIMVTMLGLSIISMICMVSGSFVGIIPFTIVLLIVSTGWTEHGFVQEKKTGAKTLVIGFITWIGSPIRIDGKCLSVNTSVILLPWLGITSIKVNMTPVTVTTPVDTLSTENGGTRIQYKLDTFSTIAADPKNLDKFVTYGNGKFDKIIEDYKGIVISLTEEIASKISIYAVASSGKLVSDLLERHLKDDTRVASMGIIIKFVKVECKVPDEIAKSAQEVLIALNKSAARVNTLEGLKMVATEILAKANTNRGNKPPMTFDEAMRIAETSSLLEAGKLNRDQIEFITSPGSTVNVYGGYQYRQQDKQQNKKTN